MGLYGLKEEEHYAIQSSTTPDWHQFVTKFDAKLNDEPTLDYGGGRGIKRAKAGMASPTSSNEFAFDLKRIGHYFKAYLGNYAFKDGATKLNIHEFWGQENKSLPSFTCWGAIEDQFTKLLQGMVCNSLKFEIGDELMSGSTEWKYKTETKKEGVVSSEDQLLIANDIPIAGYDIELEIDGVTPEYLVSNFSFDGSNGLSDKVNGIGTGSRLPVIKPRAGQREMKIEFTSILDGNLKELLTKAEYGDLGDGPTRCKLYKVPIKFMVNFCEDIDDTMTIFFPQCTVAVEYEAGEEETEVKFSLQAMQSKQVTLEDGTKVYTDCYVILENDQAEIRPGDNPILGDLTLTVVDDNTDPLSSVDVLLINMLTDTEYTGTTDSSGEIIFTGLSFGSYKVSANDGTDDLIVSPNIISVNSEVEAFSVEAVSP